MQIKVDGKEQTLRKKEFLLLKLLTSKPGKVFRRENNEYGLGLRCNCRR